MIQSYIKLNELEDNIAMIDESNLSFRNRIKIWNIAIKNETQIVENNSNSNKNPNSSFLTFEEENSLNMIFLKQNIRGGFIYDNQVIFNIFITLSHTFFFNMSYTLIIPTNFNLLLLFNYDPYFTGFIFCMTPIFSFMSNLIYTQINSNAKINRFKVSLLISEFFFVFTHLTYLLAYQLQNLSLMYLSRIFLGLSNAKVINRKYLIERTLKYDATKFSLYYFIYSTLGLASGKIVLIYLGPLLSFVFEVQQIDIELFSIKLNVFTFPSFISLLISMLLFLLTLFFKVNDEVSVEVKKEEAVETYSN